MSRNLTLLILPIEVETPIMFALIPLVDVTPSNLGSLSKLNPLEMTFTFAMLPLSAFADLVVYSRESQSSSV